MRKSRLSRAMADKAREAKERSDFLRDLPALARHEVREGCRLDEMLNRGEIPRREDLERSILDALGKGPTS